MYVVVTGRYHLVADAPGSTPSSIFPKHTKTESRQGSTDGSITLPAPPPPFLQRRLCNDSVRSTLGFIIPYHQIALESVYPPCADGVVMQVHLEDVGLGKLHPLPVRMGELSLVRPHQTFLAKGGTKDTRRVEGLGAGDFAYRRVFHYWRLAARGGI